MNSFDECEQSRNVRARGYSSLLKGQHVVIVAILAQISLPGTGCSEQRSIRGPNADEIPATVNVAASDYVAGLAVGRPRSERHIDGFSITKYPITVAQFKQCVAVGACARPSLATAACKSSQSEAPPNGAPVPRVESTNWLEGPTYDLPDAPDFPVTCTTVDQARAYCSWQGGELPTADQWLLAARGPEPRRYAWGNSGADCTQHPGGRERLPLRMARGAETVKERPAGHCPYVRSDFAVGRHPKSASPFGMEDVLLVPTELMTGEMGAHVSSCTGEACYAQGIFAASIDGFAATSSRANQLDRRQPPSGFRCILQDR